MLDNLLNALGCVKVSIWLTPWWLQSNNTKWKSSIKCYQSRRWQNNLSKEVQTKISFFGLFFHFSKSCLLTWDASGNIAQACSDSPRIPAGTCSITILQKMKHFLKPTELCRQSQSHLHQPHRNWRALHTLELLVPTPIMHCDHFPCYRSDNHLPAINITKIIRTPVRRRHKSCSRQQSCWSPSQRSAPRCLLQHTYIDWKETTEIFLKSKVISQLTHLQVPLLRHCLGWNIPWGKQFQESCFLVIKKISVT